MWNIWTNLEGEWIVVGTQRMALHFITHPPALHGISLWLSCVLDPAVPTVNFIPSKGFWRRKVSTILTEINSESYELPYHKAFQWLGSGIVLSRFFAVWEEILKCSQLNCYYSYQHWMPLKPGPIAYVTKHLTDFNPSLQGKPELPCHLCANITSCRQEKKNFRKLKIWWLLFIFCFLKPWM